jgi:hypothetical protein
MAPKNHAGRRGAAAKREADYRHAEAKTPLRPAVGTQAQFRKKKAPVAYRYDSSLSPALDRIKVIDCDSAGAPLLQELRWNAQLIEATTKTMVGVIVCR